MASKSTSWSRLVRYIPKSGGDKSYYGEPILQNDEDVNNLSNLAMSGNLKVYVLEGDKIFNLTKTSRIDEVGTLLGPLVATDVPIIRCIGLNYKTHILETGRPLPTCPTVFTKPGPSIADYGEEIPIPKVAQQQCDYEGELTIVMAKDAKNVRAEDALDYVLGYTCGNDVSARDWQREADKAGPIPQWTFSKSFDKYAPLGPCLVSKDVLGDASNLSLRTVVNGEVRQQGNTSDLCFGVAKLIEFCSQGQTIQKGSVIMTGTPGGVGLFMKPPQFLKDGDEVVVEIEKLGQLRNVMKFEA